MTTTAAVLITLAVAGPILLVACLGIAAVVIDGIMLSAWKR